MDVSTTVRAKWFAPLNFLESRYGDFTNENVGTALNIYANGKNPLRIEILKENGTVSGFGYLTTKNNTTTSTAMGCSYYTVDLYRNATLIATQKITHFYGRASGSPSLGVENTTGTGSFVFVDDAPTKGLNTYQLKWSVLTNWVIIGDVQSIIAGRLAVHEF